MTIIEAMNLAAPLADVYTALEQRLLVMIARQLSLNDKHQMNEVSKWQIQKLAQAGMLSNNAARVIAAETKGVPGNFAAAVQTAIDGALMESGLTEIQRSGEVSESAKKVVKHYRNQARDVYNQVNTVMRYKAQSRFVEAVNKFTAKERRAQPVIADKRAQLAHMNRGAAAVVTGAESRTKAVREIIHDMAEKGIPAFVDKRGREWSPEAYVNMDVRNTVKSTAMDAAFGAMDALGQDVFEVSSHAGSRPKCRPWQGKFISKSGRPQKLPT